MNTLKLINQTIKQWQHKYEDEETLRPQQLGKKGKQIPNHCPSLWFRVLCKVHPPVMLMLALTSLTGIVSYRFYTQPELAVGTISPSRIEAPKDASFEDKKTTEDLRKKTRSGLLPILQTNQLITANLNLALAKQFETIDKSRELVGNLPYLKADLLSKSSQQYLRQCSIELWQEISSNLKNNSSLSLQSSSQQIKAFQELKNYRNKSSSTDFNHFLGKINELRDKYEQAKIEINKEQITELTNEDLEILINISNDVWRQTKISVKTGLNRILIQGIHPGLPEEIKIQAGLIQLDNSVPDETKSIALKILLDFMQPNLEINEHATKNRAEKAAQAIESVKVSIKQNEIIVDSGEEITQSQFVLLDGFGLSQRGISWMGVGVSGLLVTSFLFIFLVIAKQARKKVRRRDQILLWLLSLTIPATVIFDARYTPLPAVGFLISSFYGPTLAFTNVTLMTGLVLFETDGASWEYLLAAYASSVLASFVACRLHSREELALLGGGVGLTQGGVYLIINLIGSATAGTIWYAVLPGAIGYGLIGLGCSVLALGISPYLERFFDLITPIRLAELSNPNRPLLKRLAMEAPGTFQHTMFVASLAEAAARELRCNVELVRAGTLYHDIGKMHDPKSFIENQMGGTNKHDEIANPFISAEIIKKHVSEGLVIARQYGLPKAIRDFIPQHQGTILISYFYFQAKKDAEQKGLDFNEDDFRYDGPIPQSRETAIVMLADGCEAALRSLKGATPEQALVMVQKIFKARWRENQLTECGIKYEELPQIAEIFVGVWQQFNHQRIAYPKGCLEASLTVKS